MTESVHAAGGRIFCQLWHQGRMSNAEMQGGRLPLAPSAMTAKGVSAYVHGGYVPGPVPEAASLDDIKQVVEEFRQAAICADQAGFDGVEIHGANGYMVHQFFSTQANQRTDAYGGTIENRARLLFEILDAIHEVLPPERVALRLSPAMNDMQGINLDDQTAPTFDYIVERLNASGLAYLHLMEAMKGNEVIERGFADLVSFGHFYIANPDLVSRFRTGAPLAEADKDTFYTPGAKGYIDYPAHGLETPSDC